MEYKNFQIEEACFGIGFSVCYCGDEVWFETEEEAKQFIDEVTANEGV